MFDKLDKIVVDENDFKKIRKYIDSKDDEKIFNYPLSKGVLIYSQKIDSTMLGVTLKGYAKQAIEFDFEADKSEISIAMYTTDVFDTLEQAKNFDMLLKTIITVTEDKEINVEIVDKKLKMMSNEIAKENALTSLGMLMDTLFYMSDYKNNEIIEVTEVKTVKRKSSGKSNKKSHKSNIVRITTKKYVIDRRKIPSKAKNVRRVLQWTVRGHWRHYKKSGKKVWINPYTKGNKEEQINPKEYRM